MSGHAVLLLSCPDQRGIVAATADFVLRRGGNIVSAEQYTDAASGVFFQRVEFGLDGVDLGSDDVLSAFQDVQQRFGMTVDVRLTATPVRVALMASKQPHCLYDLLTRWRSGELTVEIPLVVSNHPDHGEICAFFGVEHHHLPVTAATKADQEAEILRLLDKQNVDVVVLARYMQILSPQFCAAYPNRIINIHHSFLPAFIGARPYHQAHERGVKLIGVTAHYATADLDQGPIIEQDVMRVTHRDTPESLARKGRDLEVSVLARATRAHIEHRVLVAGRKTVVFD